MDNYTKQALKQEITYQMKLHKSLQKWLKAVILTSSLGLTCYLFGHSVNPWLGYFGLIVTILSSTIALIIGYALYNGRKNIEKIYKLLK